MWGIMQRGCILDKMCEQFGKYGYSEVPYINCHHSTQKIIESVHRTDLDAFNRYKEELEVVCSREKVESLLASPDHKCEALLRAYDKFTHCGGCTIGIRFYRDARDAEKASES